MVYSALQYGTLMYKVVLIVNLQVFCRVVSTCLRHIHRITIPLRFERRVRPIINKDLKGKLFYIEIMTQHDFVSHTLRQFQERLY